MILLNNYLGSIMRRNIRSLDQLLSAWPTFYLMTGLAILIFFYFCTKETTRNKSALPDECNEFELLDGNLESSKIILLGEYHVLRNITMLCLQALTKKMMLSQFSVYLEGIFAKGRITQFNSDIYRNTYGLLCEQSTVYCQTWENIAEQSKTEMFYDNYRDRTALTRTAIFLNQLAISDHKKLQLIKQSIHENTQLSEAMYSAERTELRRVR